MELHLHFLNGKITILKNIENYRFNGNFIEILDEQECVTAVVNGTQMMWMELFD
jgi:hypothetical protein